RRRPSTWCRPTRARSPRRRQPRRSPSPGARRAPARGRGRRAPRAPRRLARPRRGRASPAAQRWRAGPSAARAESRLATMPVVDRFVLSAYQSNCYVVRAERAARDAVVIDPGGDPSSLRLELARMGARTAAILVTHADVDHIAGVADLAEGTDADVWAPAGEIEPLREGLTRGGGRVRPHEPEHAVAGGDTISAAGLDFDVVDVAGHSAG